MKRLLTCVQQCLLHSCSPQASPSPAPVPITPWSVMTPRAHGLSYPCACLGPCANVLAIQALLEEGTLPQLDWGLQMVPGSAYSRTQPRFLLLQGWEKSYLVSSFWGSVLVHPHRLPPLRTVKHQTAIFPPNAFLPSSFLLPSSLQAQLFFEGSGLRTVTLWPAGWWLGAMLMCSAKEVYTAAA